MENPPLVSIITVNYNQSVVTSQLLETLTKISYPNYEVIVVDNASPTDNPDWLKEKFPNITLIKTEANLGFAGGNNRGIRESGGKYLLFINNDTEVPEDFLEPLVEFLESNDKAGMVSPKIKFHWDSTLIQYAGFTKMNPYTIRNSSIGYHRTDSHEFDIVSVTESVHGAAMMVPRRVIEKIGLMPEVYFLYYEEHDWAEMAKRAGFKVYYNPKSFILHKESVSTGKDSPFKTYYLNRGRLIYTRRNNRGLKLIVSLIFQIFVSLPKNTFLLLLKRDFSNLAAYWRAYMWNLLNWRGVMNNPKL